jgi:hypothetical protein
MAKKLGQLTDTGASSGPKAMSDGQRDHFKTMVSSTLDNAVALGHGHAVGSQGKRGHVMVHSDAHKQAGAYLPQAALDVATKDGGANFDDPPAKDYGTTDPGDK